MYCRPRTLTDFRRLGKKRLGKRSAKEAKRLHDSRLTLRIQDRLAQQLQESSYKTRVSERFVKIPVGSAGDKYEAEVRQANSRKQNWEWDTESGGFEDAAYGLREIDNGRYSRGCTYTHWTYRVYVRSCAAIIGGSLLFKFADKRLTRISAPHGYRWDRDGNGIRLVNRRGNDYHPDANDLINMTRRELDCGIRST